MKTKKKFLAEPFFRVVAILFVRTDGSRNSFRQDRCAQICGGMRGAGAWYRPFKKLYKNPLRYLEGILVREKKLIKKNFCWPQLQARQGSRVRCIGVLIKKLSSPPSPFFEIQLFSLRVKKGVPEIDPFYGTPGGRIIVFSRPQFLINCWKYIETL